MTTSLPEPRAGLVIRYSYLWADEHRAGREEGVKDRPSVVILAVEHRDGSLIVTVAPLNRTPQGGGAIPVPPSTKTRLGLDAAASWIVATEINQFVWPGPDLRPLPDRRGWAYGVLPAKLVERVRRSLVAEARRRKLQIVPRSR